MIWTVLKFVAGQGSNFSHGRVRIEAILKVFAKLKICPVSNLVNSEKTDDPQCIEPVRIDRETFEKPWWGD